MFHLRVQRELNLYNTETTYILDKKLALRDSIEDLIETVNLKSTGRVSGQTQKDMKEVQPVLEKEERERLNFPEMQFYDISRTEVTEVITATMKASGVDNIDNVWFMKCGCFLKALLSQLIYS